ncbi:helix-turn-helix domain-containing protein [Parvularcula dongshanensis]|uniref:Transcriptional regulator with XRE-family HTH domain n=1 Tax=Parvularcula dongshanensis TaxID=1173995 RepID=A0A840I028_9PROT|nr:transcriptional regulator with XRE-family HTH domain [Parvularcula dongshanensis]
MSAGKPLASTSAEGGTIGLRIRTARKALGLNQGALAKRLGVTQPTVANWEAGVHDPRQLMLAKIADALSVSLGWLAGGERSGREQDTSPGAPYLRRPLQHVPILTPNSLSRVVTGQLDPHEVATDYVPITYGGGRLVAVFLPEAEPRSGIPSETLFVLDTERRRPLSGELVLLEDAGGPVLHRWQEGETGLALGRVIASVRFH